MNRKLLMAGILLTAFTTLVNAREDMGMHRFVPTVENQPVRPTGNFDTPLDSIRLSDPAILADKKTQTYYMTGTGGMMWRSADLKLWEGPFHTA